MAILAQFILGLCQYGSSNKKPQYPSGKVRANCIKIKEVKEVKEEKGRVSGRRSQSSTNDNSLLEKLALQPLRSVSQFRPRQLTNLCD